MLVFDSRQRNYGDFYNTWRSTLRGCRRVCDFPNRAKLAIDLIGFVFSILRFQSVAETFESPAMTRISLKIIAKNLLRFRKLLGREQKFPKDRADGRVPCGRLAVVERVLGSDGLLPRFNRGVCVASAPRDRTDQEIIVNFEDRTNGVQLIVHLIGWNLRD